jgi:hypothetical protein
MLAAVVTDCRGDEGVQVQRGPRTAARTGGYVLVQHGFFPDSPGGSHLPAGPLLLPKWKRRLRPEVEAPHGGAVRRGVAPHALQGRRVVCHGFFPRWVWTANTPFVPVSQLHPASSSVSLQIGATLAVNPLTAVGLLGKTTFSRGKACSSRWHQAR